MFAQIIAFFQALILYTVHFYQDVLMDRSEKNSIANIEITTEEVEAAKITEIVMQDYGNDKTASALDIAIQYAKKNDEMKAAERFLEELVAPKLDKQQKKELEAWDEKIDAAIAVSAFMPEVKKKLNKEIKKITSGNLNIDQIDKLIHKALGKKDLSFETN